MLVFFISHPLVMATQRLTGVAKILAEKKAKAQKEVIRRTKLRAQLSKLYKQEGITDAPQVDVNGMNSTSEAINQAGANGETKTTGPKMKKNGRRAKPNTFHMQLKKTSNEKLEKQKKRDEFEANQKAKKEALDLSQKKRFNTHVQLSKKTKKGQPIMANVISHLLSKIESNK